MEAAQHGVPTVGYAFGLQDSVVDGQTGVLVQREAEFAPAVRDLVEDSARRARLGAAARELAARFSWEKTGARFAELLEAEVRTRGH